MTAATLHEHTLVSAHVSGNNADTSVRQVKPAKKKTTRVEKPRPLRPPTTHDLYIGYRVVATGQENMVRVQRPDAAESRQECAVGVQNSYTVSAYLDRLGAIVAECECRAASCACPCRHGRLVVAVAQWVRAVKHHSKAPLDAPVFVSAYGVPADPAISIDRDIEVLIVASRPGGPEYTFVRERADTGPGLECDSVGSGLRRLQGKN